MCNPCAPCLKAYDWFVGAALAITTMITLGLGLGGLAAAYTYHPGLLALLFIAMFVGGLWRGRAELWYRAGLGPRPNY